MLEIILRRTDLDGKDWRDKITGIVVGRSFLTNPVLHLSSEYNYKRSKSDKGKSLEKAPELKIRKQVLEKKELVMFQTGLKGIDLIKEKVVKILQNVLWINNMEKGLNMTLASFRL